MKLWPFIYVPTAEWLPLPELTDDEKAEWVAQFEPPTPPRVVTGKNPHG